MVDEVNGVKRPRREWTIMFYFASDNPLAPSTVLQLKAIKDAGFHPEANVIARFDPHTENSPPHIFEVNLVNKLKARGKANIGFRSNDPFVRTLVLDKLWSDESIRKKISKSLNREDQVDYDPPKPPQEMTIEQNPMDSLASFLSFCRTEYPAWHYMLFIMGHGLVVGNDLFLFDEHATNPPDVQPTPSVTSGSLRANDDPNSNADRRRSTTAVKQPPPEHFLTLMDLRRVLQGFSNKIKEVEKELPKYRQLETTDDAEVRVPTLDLIGFHSCSMSGIEVAYELRDTASFMLASQGPAFVGSWPYRQILIRMFNDLEAARIKRTDLKARDLAKILQDTRDPNFKFFSEVLHEETKVLLDAYTNGGEPGLNLINALTTDLNRLVDGESLQGKLDLKQPDLEGALRGYATASTDQDKKWLNRGVLTAGLANTFSPKDRPTVKEAIIRIFYYCLYNSYDFQLAGYSFDLSLTDLTRMGELKRPVSELARALRNALKDPHLKDKILLSHLDAQSFWQESYTDLYDFCLRLARRCQDSSLPASSKKLREACVVACKKVMAGLVRGMKNDDDHIIVRSEFAGPISQYTHGLSIYFPWTEPADRSFWQRRPKRRPAPLYEDEPGASPENTKIEPFGYKAYEFSETGWADFLDDYFEETRRRPRRANADKDNLEHMAPEKPNLDSELLDQMANAIFNEDGQLSKHGSSDSAGGGKHGSSDPQGGDCDCPIIKNYPMITRDATEEEVAVGSRFVDGLRIGGTIDSP